MPAPSKRWSFGGVANYTFGICRDCEEICGLNIVVETIEGDISATAYTFPRPLISASTTPLQGSTLSADDIVVPPYNPPKVAALFKQARHNLVLQNWDAAGLVYRKTLETALQFKFGPIKGNLYSVIKHVSKTQPGMFRLFAWMTRDLGNNAAHELEFDQSAAQLMDSHVEQLMVYLFTVPEIKRQLRDPVNGIPFAEVSD